MDIVKGVLALGEAAKAGQQKFESKYTPDELLKKYFNPRVPDGKKDEEITFRLLPPVEGSDELIVKAYFYNLKINGKFTKVYSLAKNDGEEDRINDAYEALRFGDEEQKKLASDYKPKLFYIIKGIQRGKEDEGVKFWRFGHNTKGQGVLDKLLPIFKKFGDISHPETGGDISISCGLDDKKNSIINTIMFDGVSKLNDNEEVKAALVADPTTWKDIFKSPKKTSVEYFQQILDGTVPYWDNTTKKFVTPVRKSSAPQVEVDTTTGNVSDDELPF